MGRLKAHARQSLPFLPNTNIQQVNPLKTTLKNLLALLDEAGIHVQNPRSGIRWYKQTGRWQVVIKVDGQNHHIGYFQDLYQAVLAREEAELRFFPNGRPPAVRKGRAVRQPDVLPEAVTETVSDDDDCPWLDDEDESDPF